MQPDLVWIKNRDQADANQLIDSVRGVTKTLDSDSDGAEGTDTDTLDAFESDGFRVDADVKVNTNTENYVAWCWKESATSGLDIVTYTGTDSAHTISHSLSAKPDLLIVKYRGGTANGQVWHKSLPDTGDKVLYLSTNHAKQDEIMFILTEQKKSVFSLGSPGQSNKVGLTLINLNFLFLG